MLEALNDMKQKFAKNYHFWSDNVSICEPGIFDPTAILGHKQITDVYLLGLCQQYGGTLVTLDARITTAAIVSPSIDLLKIL